MIPIEPIGIVRCTRLDALDDRWLSERSSIVLDPAIVGPEATLGLEDFSHIEVLFHFDALKPEEIVTTARHPRGNPAWPRVGILAQRGRMRPNALGLTRCRVVRVDGLAIEVEGLDAIDGTPVLDIKPWVQEFGPQGRTRQPDWITDLMREYW